MAGELESSKALSGLLNGLAQEAFYGHQGITEELLRSQLYPEVSLEEFRPFLAKMRGILKVSVLPAAAAAEPSLFPSALRLGTPEAAKAFLLTPPPRGLYIILLQMRGARSVAACHFLKGDPFLFKLRALEQTRTGRTLGFFSIFFSIVVWAAISSCFGESVRSRLKLKLKSC